MCVLAVYLPQSSLVSTLLSEQCRGAAEGGAREERGREGGKRMEKRRVRDRGKAFRMHYRSPGLAGGTLTRLYEGSLNQSIVIVHAQFTVLAEKKNLSPHKRDSR